MDRRRRTIRDESGIIEKFGVRPASIPDYLALVGDAFWSVRRYQLTDRRSGATFWVMPRLGGAVGAAIRAPL